MRLLSGELRQGALDGVMTDAVAKAAEVPWRRCGGRSCSAGRWRWPRRPRLAAGATALARFGLQVGRPLKPMLASSEASIDEALARIDGAAAVEWKLDGIRVQAHVADGKVRLFTRSLDDITDRLPEVVTALAALPVRDAVFDGELIALRADGRPYAFQDTASRAASEVDAARRGNRAAVGVPLRRAAPRRHRPDRPAGRGPARRAGLRRPAGDAHAPARHGRPRRGDGVLPGRRRPGPRGRRGQVADDAVRRRAARRRLDQGQAAAHPGPGRPRRRMGPRPPARAGCPTSTWERATRKQAAGSCSARPSRASPTSC